MSGFLELTPQQVAEADQLHSHAAAMLDELIACARRDWARQEANGERLHQPASVAALAAVISDSAKGSDGAVSALLISEAVHRLAAESAVPSLADRMEAAADTLEDVGRHFEYVDPTLGEWSAKQLRSEAVHVRAEQQS